ncbi:MAG TPA: hypothetical protein VF529_09280 [Solirubrobacteraceae bacterium]
MRAAPYAANARPWRCSGVRRWMSVRMRTFFAPCAMPPAANAARANASAAYAAGSAIPRPCTAIASRAALAAAPVGIRAATAVAPTTIPAIHAVIIAP